MDVAHGRAGEETRRGRSGGMRGFESWVTAGCPPPLMVNEKDGSVLVYVPGGEFEMGDGKEEDCPRHRVHVDAFYIGLYCVTEAQYARFEKETGRGDGWRYTLEGPKRDHPKVYVSHVDAWAYAEWSGLRLPSEAEWEAAARGPRGLSYPWGDRWDAARCQSSGRVGLWETSEVYGYGHGVSGYGTYNQSGNVLEWCGDTYGKAYYGESPRENPQGPKEGSDFACRGGSHLDSERRFFAGARRFRHGAHERIAWIGFRLARTA